MTTVAALLAAGLVAYALVIEPIWGYRFMASLRRRLPADPAARVAAYRLIIAVEWGLTLVACAAFLLSGLPAEKVFLALPDASALPLGRRFAVIIAISGAIGLIAGLIAARRKPRARVVIGDFDVLMPRTPRERRWYAGVALTAGICEEVLYRGVVLIVAIALFPAAPAWLLALVVAAAFGVAHVYQGVAGVIGTGVLGAILGLLVVTTGSLLPSVVLHVLIDLRVLLLPVTRDPPEAGRSPADPPPAR